MTRKQRRLTLIAAALAVLGVALGLVLFAMRDNIVFFYSPTDLETKAVTPGTRLRLGGLVAEGSVEKGEGQNVTFAVTDASITSLRARGSCRTGFFRRAGRGFRFLCMVTSPSRTRTAMSPPRKPASVSPGYRRSF